MGMREIRHKKIVTPARYPLEPSPIQAVRRITPARIPGITQERVPFLNSQGIIP
jgi:hypothetical protein